MLKGEPRGIHMPVHWASAEATRQANAVAADASRVKLARIVLGMIPAALTELGTKNPPNGEELLTSNEWPVVLYVARRAGKAPTGAAGEDMRDAVLMAYLNVSHRYPAASASEFMALWRPSAWHQYLQDLRECEKTWNRWCDLDNLGDVTSDPGPTASDGDPIDWRSLYSALSPDERVLLGFLLRGVASSVIADILGQPAVTVRRHIRELKERLTVLLRGYDAA